MKYLKESIIVMFLILVYFCFIKAFYYLDPSTQQPNGWKVGTKYGELINYIGYPDGIYNQQTNPYPSCNLIYYTPFGKSEIRISNNNKAPKPSIDSWVVTSWYKRQYLDEWDNKLKNQTNINEY